jgi:hypothetical protein
LRGGVKKVAVSLTPAFFRLAGLTPEQTKAAVEEAIKDHRYIFPVAPNSVGLTNIPQPLSHRQYQNRLMTEKPFLHAALIAIIKEAVFSGQFKTRNLHLFKSTSRKHPEELELPDSMVCLGATAVGYFHQSSFGFLAQVLQLYASLVEYRLTGERQTINFTEGAYEDTYRNHMKTLSDTRAAAPNALHKILHSLYLQVT